jgi:hypothetical protein
MVFMFSPNIVTSSAQTRSWCVPFNSNHFWTLPLPLPHFLGPSWAYSKAKLKSSGSKTSPCFRQFWIGSSSDRFFLSWL